VLILRLLLILVFIAVGSLKSAALSEGEKQFLFKLEEKKLLYQEAKEKKDVLSEVLKRRRVKLKKLTNLCSRWIGQMYFLNQQTQRISGYLFSSLDASHLKTVFSVEIRDLLRAIYQEEKALLTLRTLYKRLCQDVIDLENTIHTQEAMASDIRPS